MRILASRIVASSAIKNHDLSAERSSVATRLEHLPPGEELKPEARNLSEWLAIFCRRHDDFKKGTLAAGLMNPT